MRTRRFCRRLALLLAAMLCFGGADAQENRSLPEVTVSDSARQQGRFQVGESPDTAVASDAASLLAAAPGADVNSNGPLSGQVQYRGLFGPRMNVRVDDMSIASGGPNWMDPPLHYLPAPLVGELTLTQGIAPVSTGPGIGGYVSGRIKQVPFGSDGDFAMAVDVDVGDRSNAGSTAAALVGAANDRQRFDAFVSRERGNDRRFGGGTIADTGYARDTYGAAYGFRPAGGELSLLYAHTGTGASGNPTLPLDIDFLDTDRAGLRYENLLGDRFQFEGGVYGANVSHRMTNYVLRPAPDFSALPLPPFQGEDRRFVDARGDSRGFDARLSFGNVVEFSVGIDGRSARHDATVFDPDVAPFFVTNFNDSRTDELGLFIEASTAIGESWALDSGLRLERVAMDSGPVNAQPAQLVDAGMFGPGTPPFAVAVLRNRFNASARRRTENNVDWTFSASRELGRDLVFTVGAARKSRAPSYIERYLWVPLEVNAGLGDGNNYVGRVDLESEVSHQVELSLTWQAGGFTVRPRVFYRKIDNYIQGVRSTDSVVVAVSGNANGDTTPLVFANVGAEIYGFDADAGLDLGKHWNLYALLSWARGKRTDIDDNLYRMTPPNVRLGSRFSTGAWQIGGELLVYARDDKLSRTIVLDEPGTSNAPTPGYGVLNLFGQWQHAGWGLTFGVENLLDRTYLDPLSGFNRVIGSDVPLGAHLPGLGRNVYANVSFRR